MCPSMGLYQNSEILSYAQEGELKLPVISHIHTHHRYNRLTHYLLTVYMFKTEKKGPQEAGMRGTEKPSFYSMLILNA